MVVPLGAKVGATSLQTGRGSVLRSVLVEISRRRVAATSGLPIDLGPREVKPGAVLEDDLDGHLGPSLPVEQARHRRRDHARPRTGATDAHGLDVVRNDGMCHRQGYPRAFDDLSGVMVARLRVASVQVWPHDHALLFVGICASADEERWGHAAIDRDVRHHGRDV